MVRHGWQAQQGRQRAGHPGDESGWPVPRKHRTELFSFAGLRKTEIRFLGSGPLETNPYLAAGSDPWRMVLKEAQADKTGFCGAHSTQCGRLNQGKKLVADQAAKVDRF